MAGGSFSAATHRHGFDISIPVFNALTHSTRLRKAAQQMRYITLLPPPPTSLEKLMCEMYEFVISSLLAKVTYYTCMLASVLMAFIVKQFKQSELITIVTNLSEEPNSTLIDFIGCPKNFLLGGGGGGGGGVAVLTQVL